MAVEELGIDFFTSGFKSMQKQLSDIDKGIDDLGKTSDKSSDLINNTLSVALGNILASAAEAATQAIFDLGQSAIGVLGDSVSSAIDFQSAMTELSIAAKSTGISMEDLKSAAIAVGGASDLVGVSASDAADAITGLFKAGLSGTSVFGDFNAVLEDGNNVSGALRASIDLAAASELDMVAASELAAIALATFGGAMETDEERANFIRIAMDNMVKSADASVASVSGLAEALKVVGPTASQAGLSFSDTTNALALLSTAGIEGSVAGTNLEAMLRSLIAPSGEASDEFKKLGISLFDNQGNFKDITEIIGEFEGALGDMTQEQRSAALGNIFTANGLRTMNVLLAQGSDGWSEMAKATENAAGIQEQATAKSQTLAGRMEALQGVVETLQIQIGDALIEAFTPLVESFINFVETTGPKMVEIFSNIVQGIAFVVDEGADLLNWFTEFIESGEVANQELFGLNKTIRLIVGGIGLLSKGKLKDFLDLLGLSPSTRKFIDSVILSLKTIGITLINLGQQVASFISDKLSVFSEWFLENEELIKEFTLVVGDQVKIWIDVLSEFWNIVEPILSSLIEIILNIATLIMQVATGNWREALETMEQILINVIEGIAEASIAFIELFISVWLSGINKVKSMVVGFAKAVLNIFVDFVKKLVGNSIIPDMVGSIIKWFENLSVSVMAIMRFLVESIISAIVSLVEFITTTLSELQQWIFALLSDLVDFWSSSWNTIFEIVSGILVSITEIVVSAMQDVFDIIISKMQEISEAWQGAWNSLKDFLIGENGVIPTIVEGIRSAFNSVKEFLVGEGGIIPIIVDTIKTLISGLKDALIGAGGIFPTMISGIEKAMNSMKNTIVSAITNMVDVARRKFDEFKDAIIGAIDSIGTWIDDNLSTIQSWGQKIADAILAAFGDLAKDNPFIAKIQEAIKGLGDFVQNNSEFVGSLINIGKAIVDGIIQGLVDNTSELLDHLKGLALEVIKQILEDLGIGSPSKVTRAIGQNLVSSLALGMQDATPDLITQVNASIKPIVDIATPIPSGNGSNVVNTTNVNNFNLTTQSTTRPGGLELEFQTMSMATR